MVISPLPLPVVLFAQVPPPEHGQSRMVQLALETLRENPEAFQVHHVNARFSDSLETIGESSFGKMLLTTKYLAQAIRLRLQTKQPLLYYVPGPVKWSSVLRDWVILGVLRRFYPRVVFHWHAIGQGEWAHGSERRTLQGPLWLDRLARKISARILDSPFASISVSGTSEKDSVAVKSKFQHVINNGIKDPCPNFESEILPLREARQQKAAAATSPGFKILFLSHGTEEKGILDALDCMIDLMDHSDPTWCFQVTFAGGVSDSIRTRFDSRVTAIILRWPERIRIDEEGYLTGRAKQQAFVEHDIFLSPSRWESFGLTVIEAMAYGMQIVAASSDGVRGVLPPKHPYLSPVANPSALANRLHDCCKSIKSRPQSEAARALRQRFLDYYQLESFSEHLRSSLLELEVQGRDTTRLAAGNSSSSIQAVPFPVALPESNEPPPITIQVYLADQNPGHDRSFGISRMSQVVLEVLQASGEVRIEAITSKTSQQAPVTVSAVRVLPWGTRRKWVRLITDHLHPFLAHRNAHQELHYFPKGYLPLLSAFSHPSVVTIHDTIIQYDEDHYPSWRKPWEYAYWAMMLKHTLRRADRILTVSESSKRQIHEFMTRHRIPRNEITVTYEPCLYERFPQPVEAQKENYVIHLASCEPHKRSAHLIRWWHEAEAQGRNLPMLHLIGTVPEEVAPLLASSHSIVKSPFLEEAALQAAYISARALILPSEIEGFGLPALEAYYLGTPVCFVRGTSVEEILSVATHKGGFSLESSISLLSALDEVMAMNPAEIHACGVKLRETYAAEKVAAKMIGVFRSAIASE